MKFIIKVGEWDFQTELSAKEKCNVLYEKIEKNIKLYSKEDGVLLNNEYPLYKYFGSDEDKEVELYSEEIPEEETPEENPEEPEEPEEETPEEAFLDYMEMYSYELRNIHKKINKNINIVKQQNLFILYATLLLFIAIVLNK